ncbi:MAG: hypothetical protein HC782_03045 [Gammaproteobacteria bacterium]|nr:hypothetical protein [Gammaproteobacteria bacterium]
MLELYTNDAPLFPYCRFTDAGSAETIAVIGDSHAHVAYPGIAEILYARGINTLLLANSGCPALIGAPTGINSTEKSACSKRIENLIETVIAKNDVKRIFIFTRGPAYLTGKQSPTPTAAVVEGFKLASVDFKTACK